MRKNYEESITIGRNLQHTQLKDSLFLTNCTGKEVKALYNMVLSDPLTMETLDTKLHKIVSVITREYCKANMHKYLWNDNYSCAYVVPIKNSKSDYAICADVFKKDSIWVDRWLLYATK